ncbi:MAG TPA: DUF6600 domain-containing protein [Burkholderiaceae bacterium]|nr:DUF6600 domain-containing protein [Burkholderiaceae bacterium]
MTLCRDSTLRSSWPWGFAPFHYGRWVDVQNAWVGCPEPTPQGHVMRLRSSRGTPRPASA